MTARCARRLGAAVALAALVLAACGEPAERDVAPTTTSTTTTPATTTPATTTPATTTPVTTAPDGGAISPADVSTIGGAAAGGTAAARVDPPPPTTCERIAAAVDGRRLGDALDVQPEVQLEVQLEVQVVVHSATWSATTAVLQVATRTGDRWTCGPAMEARLGRAGTRPLLERRSGDGTTPAGVFPLATMTAPDGSRFSFFGNAPDPGVTAGAYRRVQRGDCFGATPNTPGYGHLRFDTSCPGPDDEYLPRFVEAYTNAALIGANMEPDVSGDEPGEIPYASAIFLHRHSYVSSRSGPSGPTKPTAGCVSLAQTDLTAVLLAMTPDTVFTIGPTDWLLAEA